jgi:hypothetical protein
MRNDGLRLTKLRTGALGIGRTTAVFLAAALNTSIALATSPRDPLAQETVECAAYFAIMSVALKNFNNPTGAKTYNDFRDKLIGRAALLAEQAGLKPETVVARFKIAVQTMIKRIDKNMSNVSILISAYNDLCIEELKQ